MKIRNILPALTVYALIANAGHTEKLSRDISAIEITNKILKSEGIIFRHNSTFEYEYVGDGLVYNGIHIDKRVIDSIQINK